MESNEKEEIVAKLATNGISKNKAKKLVRTIADGVIAHYSVSGFVDKVLLSSMFLADFVKKENLLQQDRDENRRINEYRMEEKERVLTIKRKYLAILSEITEKNLIDEHGFVTEGIYKNCQYSNVKYVIEKYCYIAVRPYNDTTFKEEHVIPIPRNLKYPLESERIEIYPIPCRLLKYHTSWYHAEGIYIINAIDTNPLIEELYNHTGINLNTLLLKIIDLEKVWNETCDEFKKFVKEFMDYYYKHYNKNNNEK